jgi:hypothetical protein
MPFRALDLRARGALEPTVLKWLGLLGAGVVAALVAYSKLYGWLNVLIPVLVLSWPVSLLLFRERRLGVFVVAGVVLFFLKYDRARFVPSETHRADAARLDELLRGLEGNVVVTTNPHLAVRAGKGIEQPILQGYVDAEAGGLHVDYIDALERSGARWVITTGRANDQAIAARLQERFERVRDLDLHLESLSDWDRPLPPTLWRRR